MAAKNQSAQRWSANDTRKSTRIAARKMSQLIGEGEGSIEATKKRGERRNTEMTVQREEPEQVVTPIAGEQAGEYGDGEEENTKVATGDRGKKGVSQRRHDKGKKALEMAGKSVECLCSCKVERGEMVCCDLCEGWFHLECLGMKEGVGVLEGKDFVCHFCLSSCVLKLREQIVGLMEELGEARSELKEVKEVNGMLQDRMGQEETRRVVEQTSVRTRKVAQVEKVTGDTMEGVQCSEQEDESVGEEVTVQKSHDGGTQRSGKQAAKHIGGVRKVWGTRKNESCNGVAKGMVSTVGRVATSFSVMKRVANLGGKNRWWFIVKAPESTLRSLDKKWEHKHWQWQRIRGSSGAFLGADPVPSRHR